MPNSPGSGRAALLPWMVVGAVWVTLAIASGLYFSFPVFFVALLEEFGWPRGATAAAFSISSIAQGALSPVVGMLVDRVGPRRVMLGGAVVLGSACVLASRIDSLASLYLVTGVLAAAGVCAVSWIPSGALIARWGPAVSGWRARGAGDSEGGFAGFARKSPAAHKFPPLPKYSFYPPPTPRPKKRPEPRDWGVGV